MNISKKGWHVHRRFCGTRPHVRLSGCTPKPSMRMSKTPAGVMTNCAGHDDPVFGTELFGTMGANIKLPQFRVNCSPFDWQTSLQMMVCIWKAMSKNNQKFEAGEWLELSGIIVLSDYHKIHHVTHFVFNNATRLLAVLPIQYSQGEFWRLL